MGRTRGACGDCVGISALGLGLLLSDATPFPRLLAFLPVLLSGLWLGLAKDRNPLAVVVCLAGAVVTAVSLCSSGSRARSRPLAFLGVAGLLAASFLDRWIRHRQLRA